MREASAICQNRPLFGFLPTFGPDLARLLTYLLVLSGSFLAVLPTSAQEGPPADGQIGEGEPVESDPEEAQPAEPEADGEAGTGEEEEPGPPEAEDPSELEDPRVASGRRLAVLVHATPGVEPSTADALTELVIGAVVARGGVTVVGKEEFQALLGQGDERSIECVSSSACLGRIGVQLGVDELIAGTVGRRRNVWVFNLNRIDIRSGELVGRTFREVEGDLGAVADEIQGSVPDLFEVDHDPAHLRVTANVDGAEVSLDGALIGVYRGEPLEIADLRPGRHDLVVSAAGHFDWVRTVNVGEGTILEVEANLEAAAAGVGTHTSPLVWVGAGFLLAGLGTGVVFGAMSQDVSSGSGTRREAVSSLSDREGQALIANAGFAVAGAGLLTLGLGLLLSDFSDEELTNDEASAELGVRIDSVGVEFQQGPRIELGGRF